MCAWRTSNPEMCGRRTESSPWLGRPRSRAPAPASRSATPVTARWASPTDRGVRMGGVPLQPAPGRAAARPARTATRRTRDSQSRSALRSHPAAPLAARRPGHDLALTTWWSSAAPGERHGRRSPRPHASAKRGIPVVGTDCKGRRPRSYHSPTGPIREVVPTTSMVGPKRLSLARWHGTLP